MLRHILATILNPRGKSAFLFRHQSSRHVLDIGCGNNSVLRVKSIISSCSYTGVDIDNYNLDASALDLIDHYINSTPSNFASDIQRLPQLYDCILCSHNLEHCNSPYDVVVAMGQRCAPGGHIYISYPSPLSLVLPSRTGVLNYYDDGTHQFLPPDSARVIDALQSTGEYTIRLNLLNRPSILFFLGFLLEPLSSSLRRNFLGTWYYKGFETTIQARKK